MTIKDKDTPLALVRKWSKTMPDAYKTLDAIVAEKAAGLHRWTDACTIPILFADGILSKDPRFADPDSRLDLAPELLAAYLWRRHKAVYAFDPDLAESLADQADDVKDTDVIPVDMLLSLPYPCPYIKCSSLFVVDGVETVDGFFSFIDQDNGHLYLHIQALFRNMTSSLSFHIALMADDAEIVTIGDALRYTLRQALQADPGVEDVDPDVDDISSHCHEVLSCLQLLLYILAANADSVERPRPTPKDRKTGAPRERKGIEDKLGEIAVFDVGVRIGAALRRSTSAPHAAGTGTGTGSAKRPHTRRGHWHHYWTGSPKDESARKLILKWTAPTFIHAELGDDTVTVVPVKK